MTRRVLILGANSAMAQEAGRWFAAEHARLVLVARGSAKLQSVAEDLKVRGAEAVLVIEGDLVDDSVRPAILDRAAAEWQGLDAALIAYGALPDQPACEDDPATLRAALEINGVSVIAWMSQLAKVFEAQHSGVLAVIGSVAGDRGRGSNYAYGSAKAAIEAFASGLRQRLAASGVSVVLIKPGWVNTPMTAHLPKNFLYASAEQVGHGIYKAVLSPKPVVYLPWYWRCIMLPIRMMPQLVFNKLKL